MRESGVSAAVVALAESVLRTGGRSDLLDKPLTD
jgi:hypothetical protein